MDEDVFAQWWKGDLKKLFVALLATSYFFYYLQSAREWHFIDGVNLLIHEAGHWVFLPFGSFMHVLGGSLFQILFPCVYVGYFYLRRDYYSSSLLLFWVGQNIVNVSIYAGDAVALQLPLLGGDVSTHDWHYLLSTLNLLNYTPLIGSVLYTTGVVVVLIAACLSIWFSQTLALSPKISKLS